MIPTRRRYPGTASHFPKKIPMKPKAQRNVQPADRSGRSRDSDQSHPEANRSAPKRTTQSYPGVRMPTAYRVKAAIPIEGKTMNRCRHKLSRAPSRGPAWIRKKEKIPAARRIINIPAILNGATCPVIAQSGCKKNPKKIPYPGEAHGLAAQITHEASSVPSKHRWAEVASTPKAESSPIQRALPTKKRKPVSILVSEECVRFK